jgi:hypothetical protein
MFLYTHAINIMRIMVYNAQEVSFSIYALVTAYLIAVTTLYRYTMEIIRYILLHRQCDVRKGDLVQRLETWAPPCESRYVTVWNARCNEAHYFTDTLHGNKLLPQHGAYSVVYNVRKRTEITAIQWLTTG